MANSNLSGVQGIVSSMTGATSYIAGTIGSTPQNVAGDNAKLLVGNGTWGTSLISKISLTSGTTYTPTSGTNKIIAYLVGGGGGGGACSSSAGTSQGTGGGAGAVIGFLEDVSDLTTYTYSIGPGGASGVAGTQSTITINSNTYTAGGGGAGGGGSLTTPAVVSPGTGGTTVPAVVTGNAFLIANGAPGAYSIAVGSNCHASGQGGSSMFGGGGASQVTNSPGNSVGAAGLGHGAGGSGSRTNNSVAVAGGAGSGGYLLIFEIR